ncbi:FAD dependent oxidoreductase protein [Rutstroemia sp. NJR-2017a BVV2]|nr:FAD dependent oxidoreductase protein [Rutstroemia sp. NJR-2017a BVV2]
MLPGKGRSFWMDDFREGGKEGAGNGDGGDGLEGEGNENKEMMEGKGSDDHMGKKNSDGDNGGKSTTAGNENDNHPEVKEKQRPLPSLADIVVIGSGISGAAAVWELMFGEGSERRGKGEKIVMLEARGVCEGATGRNGGHTKAASYRSFPHHAKVYGVEEAVKIARFEYENILWLHGLCGRFGIRCGAWVGETVDLFFEGGEGEGEGSGDGEKEGKTEWEKAKRGVRELWGGFEMVSRKGEGDGGEGVEKQEKEKQKGGVQWYEFFEAEEARGKFQVMEGKRKLLGALRYVGGSVSAYAFVRGVLDLCLREGGEGFEIFEGREVVGVEREGGGDSEMGMGSENGKQETKYYSVRTADGSLIRAKHVVLATNGYTGFLRKEFQGVIVPLRGQVTGQRFVSGREGDGKREGDDNGDGGLEAGKESEYEREGKGIDTKTEAKNNREAEAARNRTYSFIYPNGFDYLVPFPTGLETRDSDPSTENHNTQQQTYILGGGLTYAPGDGMFEFGELNDSEVNPDVSTYLRGCLQAVFGGEGTWRTEREWTGVMGYSADGLPFVGRIEENGGEGEQGGLWITASFQGHGMVLCWGCAKEVVRGIRGLEGESGFPEVYRMRKDRLGRGFEGFVE